MAKWETFTFRGGRGLAEIRVSLNPRGVFTLNQFAFDELGKPDNVVLMYDTDDHLIGITGTDEKVDYAIKVRRQGENKSYLIGGRAFTQYYGIDLGETVRFNDARVEQGMLILDPKKVTPIASKGGAKEQAKAKTLFES